MRIFLFLFLISIPAYAGIYIEPEVGYEAGKFTETYVDPPAATVTANENVSGYTYGGKLGYRKHFYFLGGEYEGSALTKSTNATDASAFFGISVLHLRFWASYIFKAKLSDASGTGYKLGVGMRLLYWLRLNGEYSVRNYNSLGTTLPAGSSFVASLKSFKVTLSLPLGL